MKKTIALVAFAGLTLAACHSQEEAPAPVNDTIVNTDVTTEPSNITDTPQPTEPVNVVSAAPAPTATLAADQQTVEDAAATGMTAKVDRNAGGNESDVVR